MAVVRSQRKMSFVGVGSEKDVLPDGLSVSIARSGYGRNEGV